MLYAKEIIKDKFWIVKDNNVNVATVEKKDTDNFLVIKENNKHTFTKTQINEFKPLQSKSPPRKSR